MENILKGSHPKMTGQNDRQDESLTGQVHDQAGHCPLTGRYFEPCPPVSSGAVTSSFLSISVSRKFIISKVTSPVGRPLLGAFSSDCLP